MNRQAVYARVTQGILDRLASGVAPWRKPWDALHGRPRNLVSGRPYSGVNAFALGLMGRSPFWLTIAQVNRMGFRVRKGSRGVPVIFCKQQRIRDTDTDGNPVERTLSIVKLYHVFNALDVDGLQLPQVQRRTWQGVEGAETILAGVRPAPVIRHGGDKAFFSPALDYVQLPERGAFHNAAGYYSAAFHELTHWTGHPSRLNRPTLADAAPFGSPAYCLEELVAEMGAGFLCCLAGIENAVDENASYLQGWLEKLRGEPGLIVRAAAQAQRAVDFLAPDSGEADTAGEALADEAEVAA